MHRVHADAHTGQKRPLDPLKLEVQTVVDHLILVLGAEPRSSAKAVYALNC